MGEGGCKPMTGEEQMAGGGAGDGDGCILICLSARDKVVSSAVNTTQGCLLEQLKRKGKNKKTKPKQNKKNTATFPLKIHGSASQNRIEFGCVVPIKLITLKNYSIYILTQWQPNKCITY